MIVICAPCGVPMRWERVVAVVPVPQHEGVQAYRIDRFRCAQCKEQVDCEVDTETPILLNPS